MTALPDLHLGARRRFGARSRGRPRPWRWAAPSVRRLEAGFLAASAVACAGGQAGDVGQRARCRARWRRRSLTRVPLSTTLPAGGRLADDEARSATVELGVERGHGDQAGAAQRRAGGLFALAGDVRHGHLSAARTAAAGSTSTRRDRHERRAGERPAHDRDVGRALGVLVGRLAGGGVVSVARRRAPSQQRRARGDGVRWPCPSRPAAVAAIGRRGAGSASRSRSQRRDELVGVGVARAPDPWRARAARPRRATAGTAGLTLARRRGGCAETCLKRDRHRRLAVERDRAGQQLVEDHADRVQVRGAR